MNSINTGALFKTKKASCFVKLLFSSTNLSTIDFLCQDVKYIN